MTDEIRARIRTLIVDHVTGVDPAKISDDARFDDELDADSLDAIELAMACEEEWGIEINNAEVDAIATVGDLVKIVQNKIEARV